MNRIVALLLVPVGGVLLLGPVLGALSELRGLGPAEYVAGGLLVGAVLGVAVMRLLDVRGPRAVPWVLVAALLWASAAALHGQLSLLAQEGHDPFSAWDWFVRTSPGEARHLYAREVVAGIIATLGAGMPILRYLPSPRAQRILWWLAAACISGAAWMLQFHSVAVA